jgi:hypothetical protein
VESEDIKTAVVTFGLLAESEGKLADLYIACGKAAGDADYWNAIADQETEHVENLKEMARLIREADGAGFNPSREFPAGALRTFMRYVDDNLGMVRNGGLQGIELYRLACSIEKAVLSQRYPDIVRTDNPAFNGLMERTISETEQHLKSLEARIANFKG